MIAGVNDEVILGASYALVLVAVAFLLEMLARHSHRRTEGYRNSGFVYHHESDRWQCPAGEHLLRNQTDYQRRITHYRASASACNACALKNNCTDSDEGRLLLSHSDSWIESELRRFHRGLSLSLLLLAAIILAAEAVRHSGPRELLIVICLLLPLGLVSAKLLGSFFFNSSGLPMQDKIEIR